MLVVIQQSAPARSAANCSNRVGRDAIDQCVSEPLMIAFKMVMRNKLVHGASEMSLTEGE